MYVCIYIYIYIYICVCIYIYIYIYRGQEVLTDPRVARPRPQGGGFGSGRCAFGALSGIVRDGGSAPRRGPHHMHLRSGSLVILTIHTPKVVPTSRISRSTFHFS